ncbi:MAG TPA: ATP synthase F0 subunit C [Candidatus Cloacimonadota bacterium]|nr:ATP synthase F0 subunit C [Candidatus Cloacimonadota bacterium]HOQ79804.1 ATP synthase F0 subunit C [Candidatus Cloacimonadota bacterium]HPK40793.1 ATP synthase F0 subunit C [Candidatus Cloacimonadota bacterium]
MVLEADILKVFLYTGAALSTGIASLSAGFGEGYAAAHTARSIMRQPNASSVLTRTMLISQAVVESGAIFALVISMLLLFGGFTQGGADWAKAFSLLGAGLAIGLGCTGPNFGSGYSAARAIEGIGRNPSKSGRITANMLIGQAITESGTIFALVVSLLLLYTVPAQMSEPSLAKMIMKACAYITAGIVIGIGTFGPGTGIGYVAGKANISISKHSKDQGVITRTMFLGAAVSESTAIYALVISFLLIFVS